MKSFTGIMVVILNLSIASSMLNSMNCDAQKPGAGNAKNCIVQIFVSADSPCYVDPETITISYDTKTKIATYKHSGLVVMGQGPGARYEISKAGQNNLPTAKYDTLVKLVNDNTKWFTTEKGIYSSGCSYTISVKWIDDKGSTMNRTVNSYDFKDNEPPVIFYDIITKVSKLCIGTDMVSDSHIRYD